MLNRRPFEKAILHFDGDSFFASVEQVMDYRLKGKALVTGGERGAITSASIEAKKLGIGRGIPLRAAKDLCPELIIVRGDYLSYSIFAHRMYKIVREFAGAVEEYSIDECFADITGLDQVYKKSYEEIALMIKEKLEKSLGVTFGVGLGPSKVLAKVASKHRKPGGFTTIKQENLQTFLQTLPLGKVWGIGPSSSLALHRLGLRNAWEFSEKSLGWIEANKVSKPYRETWLELQGYYTKELNLTPEAPKSIIVSRTFSPPSSHRSYVLSQLSKNIESACAKARRHGIRPKDFRFYLKTQEFRYHGFDVSMPLPTSSPLEMMQHVRRHFDEVYRRGVEYRATGVSLKRFSEDVLTLDLFGSSNDVEKESAVFKAVDNLAHKYGENLVHLGSSLNARKNSNHTPQKYLDIPFLGIAK